jgi:hypothetical protein
LALTLLLPLSFTSQTNYLDREALGALAEAIRGWTGGVVIISHHQEFIGAVCEEVSHTAVSLLSLLKSTCVLDDPVC